jgi:hypothetical protein
MDDFSVYCGEEYQVQLPFMEMHHGVSALYSGTTNIEQSEEEALYFALYLVVGM